MNNLKNIFYNITAPIDTEAGALINVPNWLIRMSIFMSINSILQAVVDISIEILMTMHLFPLKVPFRLEFLFLTILSTTIAYLTLKGLREGNLDVTRNTLFIGLLVELSLVLGDVYLLFNTHKDFWPIFFFRLIFILLTLTNIMIISNLIYRNIKTRRARPNYRF